MEFEDIEQQVNYSLCLICNSSVIIAEIKEEPFDNQDENQSVIIFLLSTLLEIPQNEVIKRQEKLINQQLSLSSCYCESCTKLIYSAKQIYTEILQLTQKFRNVQKQIVDQISTSGTRDLNPGTGTTFSTFSQDGLFKFCRNFLNEHDFNGFGYPIVVDKIPEQTGYLSRENKSPPPLDKVKEEPVSENEAESEDHCYLQDNQSESESDFEPEPPRKFIKKEPNPTKSRRLIVVKADEDKDPAHKTEKDNPQNSSSPSASEDCDNQSDSNSESEPPPPPKKKIPLRQKRPPPPPRPRRKGKTQTRKERIAAALAAHPHSANKHGFLKPLSKFEKLYPTYPKILRNPTTSQFHCFEPSCSKSYPKKENLERHIIIQHLQDNYFKCGEPFCGKSYASPEIFQDHVSWHAGIPRWKCEEKVKVTPTTSNGDSGTSDKCPKAFFHRRQLARHVQEYHQEDNPIICEICGKRVTCYEYLSAHKYKYHNKDKPFEDYSTAGAGAGVERKKKVEPLIHICNYCGKLFKSKVLLDSHINWMHEKNVGKFSCQFCQLKFWKKSWLKQHLWKKHDKFSLEGYQPKGYQPPMDQEVKGHHVQVKGCFQCEVRLCRRVFRKEKNLKKHMEEKHGGGGGGDEGKGFRFNCKFCGKGFHLKPKLDIHEEAHENRESKPFECEICGKGFATVHYLKIHERNMHVIKGEGVMGEGSSKK